MQRDFQQLIRNHPIHLKLYKYRHYCKIDQQKARSIREEMLMLALQNQLIGEYQLICQCFKQPIQQLQKYKTLRTQFIISANKVKVQMEQYETTNNTQEHAKCCMKLAKMYSKVGNHGQACVYFSKLCRETEQHIYKRSDYFQNWGYNMFLINNFTDLGMFLSCTIEDPKLKTVNLALLQDLKLVQMRRPRVFDNILNKQFQQQQIINNSIITIQDLGFIYSLVALAYKPRQFLKIDCKWSSKIQKMYLNCQYKEVLQNVQNQYQNYAHYNPLIAMVYSHYEPLIRRRIILQNLTSYQQISFAQIQQKTTISEGQVRIFVRNNKQMPFLIDPITSSVVYYKKIVPLYKQSMMYYQNIKSKYNNIVKSTLKQTGGFEDDYDMHGTLGNYSLGLDPKYHGNFQNDPKT